MRSIERPWMGLILAGSLIALMVPLTGCEGEGQGEADLETAEPGAPQVEVARIELSSLDERREWSGQLEALHRRPLQAPSSGYVEGVAVRQGDLVDAGDELFRVVEPGATPRRQILMQRRDYLQEEYQRWEELSEAGAAGPAEVNEARLRLLEVQESLAEVDAALGVRRVRSPWSGRVAGLEVGDGSNVSAGQLLAHIDDHQSPGVRLIVSGAEARYLERTEAIEVRDQQGELLTIGEVLFDPSDHPSFREARVYLKDAPVASAQQIFLRYQGAQEIPLVPWTALARDGDQSWVALVSGDPPSITRRDVELGRGHSAGVEVVEGLEVGDEILRYEPRAHPDGREVQPRREEQ